MKPTAAALQRAQFKKLNAHVDILVHLAIDARMKEWAEVQNIHDNLTLQAQREFVRKTLTTMVPVMIGPLVEDVETNARAVHSLHRRVWALEIPWYRRLLNALHGY